MIHFRLDRFLTLYLFRYMTQKQISGGDKPIPILMYHSISNEKERLPPYYRINTSPAIFNEHMRYLYEHDYSVINLQDLEKSFYTRDASRYVVLTFDDGFRDFYTSAYMILKNYGFGATVFLPTGFIHHERRSFKGKECMTWNEVRALSREGILFGSHTITHPQLSHLTTHEIEDEIKLSMKRIEDETGLPVQSFSYPFAFPGEKAFQNKLIALLKKSGYINGVTTIIGRSSISDSPFFLKRLPVNNDDDQFLFQSKLEGAYDWLHAPQSFLKYIKRSIDRHV